MRTKRAGRKVVDPVRACRKARGSREGTAARKCGVVLTVPSDATVPEHRTSQMATLPSRAAVTYRSAERGGDACSEHG